MRPTHWRPVHEPFGVEDTNPRTLEEFRQLAIKSGKPQFISDPDNFRVDSQGHLHWWEGHYWTVVGEAVDNTH